MIEELSSVFPAPEWEVVQELIDGVQCTFAAADLVVAIAVRDAPVAAMDWRGSQLAFQRWREEHRSGPKSCDLHLLLIVPDRSAADELQDALDDHFICRKIVLVRRVSGDSPIRSLVEVLASDYPPCRPAMQTPQPELFRMAPSNEEYLEHALDVMKSAKEFVAALLNDAAFPESMA